MRSSPGKIIALAIGVFSSATAVCPLFGKDAASIPDFSGNWGRNTLDYGAPAAGPGPVANIAAREDLTIGDYRSRILKPWAAEIVKKMGEVSKTGNAFPTAHNQCWPEITPYIFGNREMEVLQRPDRITLIYSHDHQVRRIRMNASHPRRVVPSWYGDSVGRYEGDTLVVDTIGIAVKPLSTVDRYGTPHSEALHVVERYQLIDPNSTNAEAKENLAGFRGAGDGVIDRNYKGRALRIDFRVDDPKTFNSEWSGTVVFRRAKGEWIEDVCPDAVHDYITGKDENVPTARTALFGGG